jgi:acetyl esterase/lipase
MKMLAVFACAAACGGAGDSAKKPVMLLFHGGGFIYNMPMNQAIQAARHRGFQPRVVDYPLGNVPAAVKRSVRLARRLSKRRSVYAYGDSAGGTLASLLAERGLVKAAATQAPVSNIGQWAVTTGNDPARLEEALHLNAVSAREFSPSKHRARSPIFAEAPVDDAISGPTLVWARKSRLVMAVSVPGNHLDPAYYASNLERAMWFLAMRRKADRGRHPLVGVRY